MRYVLVFLAAYIFLPAFVQAQSITREAVQANINTLATGFPQENIYVQFDKPAYAPGETIWYKLYINQGSSPSLISANVYVDATTPDGKVLTHQVLPVLQASARGSFDIPEAYKSKYLHIRAYTKWMLNFDSSFLFDKNISVLQRQVALQSKVVTPVSTINFFAEGGDCIAGVENKMAFKAVKADGQPLHVTGTIVNSKGATVTTFSSSHDGMGYFLFTPAANEKYTAHWKDENSKAVTTALPGVKASGVVLEVKNMQGRKGFVIHRTNEIADNFKTINMVATMEQNLVYMATVTLDDKTIVGGSIPTEQLPSGILTITLFDANWVAFAERISFVNNNNYSFEPEVGFSALGLNKRGKNTLVINLPDSVEANLSVAVTDKGIGIDSSDNIFTRLLLTGELKGKVYNPSYYFSSTEDSVQDQLDLVMLTNGWRKIKWEDVVKGKMPAIKYPNDTAYLTIAGKVFGASEIDMRQSPLLFLIIDHPEDSTRKPAQVFINNDGTFTYPDYVLFDTTRIYYQFAGNKAIANTTEIVFDNGSVSSPGKIDLSGLPADPYQVDTAAERRNRFLAEQQALVEKLIEGTTLQAVTVTAKTKTREEILDAQYASGLFTGGQATSFDVENDPSARSGMTVLNYLKGRIAGLTITGENTVGATPSLSWRGSTPDVFINEFQADLSQIQNVDMSDVAYIKVFQPPFFGSFGGGGGGAIAVYTKKGNTNQAPKGKGMPFKTVIGYAPEKEFYSPNYGTFNKQNEFDDMRSTLYWNPMIVTTKENHTVRFTFYNNDITSSFRIIAEGVTKDGKLVHVEKTIE